MEFIRGVSIRASLKIYDLFALSFLVYYFVIEIIYKIKVSEDMVLNHRVKEDIVCKHPRSRGP